MRTGTKNFPSVVLEEEKGGGGGVKCMQGQKNYLLYPFLDLREKWDFAFELLFTTRRAEQVI